MSEMHQLLGLDPRIERPNAYQIFGLQVLESDGQTIREAIGATIARLKGAKESADASAWAQAAKSVNKAQQILADPQQKAKYDSRLQSTFESVAVAASQPAMAAVGAPPAVAPPAVDVDPLADWLPDGDPFSAFDMAAALEELSSEPALIDQEIEASMAESEDNVASSSGVAGGGNPFGHSAPTHGGELGYGAPAGGPIVADAIVNTPKKRARRKRGFPVAGIFMTLFVLGLFGAMGYCVKLLMDRESKHAAEIAQVRPAAAAPPAATPQRPRDNVMGDLLPEGSPTQSTVNSGIEMGVLLTDDGPMPDDGVYEMPRPPEMTTPMEMNEPSEMMTPEEPMVSPTPETPAAPTAEMVAASTAAIEQARDAIRSGDWQQMMPKAEKALELAKNPQQQATASALRRLVHYAGQYQEAIDRSLEQSPDTLEIREGLAVGVVEITPTELTLRLPGRNKTYERASLPAIVANALAPLSLPKDEALLTVFRGAWQCLQKEATPADREAAFKDWQGVAGQSDDADVTGLEAEVKAIFP